MFGTRVLHKLARLALVLNLPVTSGADIPQNGGNGQSRHVLATEIHALAWSAITAARSLTSSAL